MVHLECILTYSLGIYIHLSSKNLSQNYLNTAWFFLFDLNCFFFFLSPTPFLFRLSSVSVKIYTQFSVNFCASTI